MIKTKKLTKAISMAIAGSALALGANTASAHVMYNLFQSPTAIDTDGWAWGGIGRSTGRPAGVVNPVNTAAANPGFSGTADSNGDGFGDAPFGYTGSSHLNWAAALHNTGSVYTICGTACGGVADIDTGAGSWMDNGIGDLTKRTGWKHLTEIGLIKADHDMNINITAEVVGGTSFENFGMTLFSGMDTNTGDYSHHGGWNSNSTPSTSDNPFGTTGLTYLTYDSTVSATNAFSYTLKAGQVYSLYLGGNTLLGRWNQNVAEYKLNITTSAVPVPGAVWLFGSAIAGVAGLRRRQKAA